MLENQLQVIVDESGLESTKAKSILDQFKDYFEMASEWEVKARAIVVTDASQTADMQMARIGRLFLQKKRGVIEKSRKALKEQALREGKAIDGIANVLKALIVPIEEYLDKQEHFVEIKAKIAADQKKKEEEAAAEVERLAKEKAEREEQEKIRLENIRLREEAKAMELKAKKERKEAEDKLVAEREDAETKLKKEREKAEVERKKERAALAEREAELEKIKTDLAATVECPECHHKFIPVKRG